MRLNPHFVIQEFVGPQIFDLYGDNSIRFINPLLPEIAFFIRMRYKRPTYVNNWHMGGENTERGYREPGSNTGDWYSCHKLGNAMDISVQGMLAAEVQEDIKKRAKDFHVLGVRILEVDTPAHTHLSVSWTRGTKLAIIRPK
jgi:hypothetical protein